MDAATASVLIGAGGLALAVYSTVQQRASHKTKLRFILYAHDEWPDPENWEVLYVVDIRNIGPKPISLTELGFFHDPPTREQLAHVRVPEIIKHMRREEEDGLPTKLLEGDSISLNYWYRIPPHTRESWRERRVAYAVVWDSLDNAFHARVYHPQENVTWKPEAEHDNGELGQRMLYEQ